ncbi:MAG: cysteine desulfurase family protein [Hyphomicrobiaceae bacterium]|nr:cysteine desulfurase family protein [Hyphomicrobiaceae bacterium]
MSTRVYLDWNATAPLHPAARAAMLEAMQATGNPSSPHWEGRHARSILEGARERIAAAVGAEPRNVYFTSGATEAANWVLTPTAVSGPRPLAALLVGATEHACVLAGHRFAEAQVETLAVAPDGLVDIDRLSARLAALAAMHGPRAAMVAIQAANNETGVVQPLAAVLSLAAESDAVVVCDAVQLAGRGEALPAADILFLSAHKLGGPKGIGAVIVRRDDLSPGPLVRGGGQERRQRSGTENVAAAAGFAAALEAATETRAAAMAHGQALRTAIETGLKRLHPATVVFAEGAPRLPNTTLFAVPGVAAETALIALDLTGVAVSSGSACSSGKVAASHVLAAMGVAPDLARCALRVSTGPATTARDVEVFLGAWEETLARRHARAA